MTTDPKIYRIVTFNVRYGSAWDGWNSWSQRKRAFCETVCSLTPSILCLQEPEYFQINEIISTVAESHDLQLGYVGVGRDDGGTQGEFSPILYDVRKFEVLRGGTFWLSETPDTPSRSFGAKLNRICSWAELRDKWRGISLVVFNLHLDADYNTVRVCQNSVFLTKIQELGLDTLPSIFCGDFNNETDGALEIKILEAY
ncbi:hypothetical protein HK102_005333 [Quaeritorhiza haematococci]|nr:hypothetical protein HK102_005333 [Quaeritorhiza haematococci]